MENKDEVNFERSKAIKPFRRLSEKERNEDDYQWYKDSASHFISLCSFSQLLGITTNGTNDMAYIKDYNMLFNLYHNDIKEDWFIDLMNPLKSDKANFVSDVKVQPINILNPTINFLHSNFRRRNFNYTVINEEADAHNRFTEAMNKKVFDTIIKRFSEHIQGEQVKPIDLVPEKLRDDFRLGYMDVIANKFQKRLKNTIEKNNVLEVFSEMFLDFLIVGEPVSAREMRKGKPFIRRVDRRLFEYDMNPDIKYIENSEWCCEVELVSPSDVYERYDLTDVEMNKIDDYSVVSSDSMKRYAEQFGLATYRKYLNKIPIFHVYWRGRKKIGILSYYDENGFLVEQEVIDTFVHDPETQKIEWKYVNTIFKVDRIFHDIYKNMGEFEYEIEGDKNYGKPLMPYNGIKFAHYYNEKIYSPYKLGIPLLVMTLSCLYLADKMLRKHKGKMVLLDVNSIPNSQGWTEEKFMFYASEMGYMFVNRQQEGVDKTFNQYTTIEVSTLQDASELFKAADYYKRLWDDIISIPPQMRGQSYASDEVGTTKSAIFQSGISIDNIYQKFDDFLFREYNYMLALERYSVLEEGDSNTPYITDDGLHDYLEISQLDAREKLGIHVSNQSKEEKQLESAKQYALSVNQQDPIAVITILTATSITDLKKTLLAIQDRQNQREEAMAQQQQAGAEQIERMKEDFEKIKANLEAMLINVEYDRKQELQDSEVNGDNGVDKDRDGVPDYTEAYLKNNIEQQKVNNDREDIRVKEELGHAKIKADKQKNKTKTK